MGKSETELIRAVKVFQKVEGRSDFFALAENICKDHLIEAVIIILGTWNFAVFRYHLQKFDIKKTSKTLGNVQDILRPLKGKTIQSVDLEKHRAVIISAFNSLSAIKGIEFTGASKVLHLLNKDLFVMWDGYIRGEKSKRYYREIKTDISKYGKDGDSYLAFLKDMQIKYQEVQWQGEMTLARAIDAYNYVNVTIEIQKIEKRESEKKKAEKKALAEKEA
ncbi:hypothetical protein SDC9_04322 [bioreactor metagenome]|uniref:Uncharacterized protein n=1 Tax=bioreactor metagenome TaxID=1076179 RepID=A0A644SVP2_9ZZZZ